MKQGDWRQPKLGEVNQEIAGHAYLAWELLEYKAKEVGK